MGARDTAMLDRNGSRYLKHDTVMECPYITINLVVNMVHKIAVEGVESHVQSAI